MRLKSLLTITIAVGLLTGCGGKDYSDQILPLAVGNQWTYRVTYYDSTEAVIRVDTTTRNIEVDTIINDETWYAQRMSTVVVLTTNRPDGEWNWNTKYAKEPHLTIKFPVEEGDLWSWDDFYGGHTFALKADKVGDTIEVPAGQFVCNRYRLTHTALPPGSHGIFYYAPGVGMVRFEEYRSTESDSTVYLRTFQELISYDLK